MPTSTARRRSLQAAPLIAVAAAAAAWWSVGAPQDPAVTPAAAPAAPAVPAESPRPARWGCGIAKGERLAVDGVHHVAITVNYIALRRSLPALASQMPKGLHKSQVKVGWHLELLAVDADESGATLRGDWTARPEASDKAVAAQQGQRRVGVRLRVGKDCQLSAVQTERGVDPKTLTQVVQQVTSLGFAYPAEGAAQVQVTELVENAEVELTWRTLEPGGRRLRGTFRGYLKAFADLDRDKSRVVALPRSGLKSVDASDESWFASLDGTLTSRSAIRGAESKTHYHARKVTPDPAWTLRPFELGALDYAQLVRDAEDADVLAEIDKYKNKSLGDMFALMDQMEKDGEPVRAQVSALTYWLLGHKDQIPAYVDRLRRGDFASQRRKAHATSALAQTQLPEAAEAIRSLFTDDHCDAQVRAQAIVSMGLELKDPPMKAVDDLLALGSSTTTYPASEHMASLLAGAMANQQRERHPEIHAKVVAWLDKRLRNEHGEKLFNALKGAGNSGEPKLLPLVEQHLTSEEAEPHAAAWKALTGMPYASLEAAFPRLLASAQTPSERLRLYVALSTAAVRAQAAPSPAVLKATLTELSANGYASSSAQMDKALIQLATLAWKQAPDDPALLAVLRAKFQRAMKDKNTKVIDALVGAVGVDKLAGG